ncbi:MAG: response regulator [Elusimicrobia bacterium]|nr:response regulator [Candidatus Obscuribacterium magneticum]
MPLNKILLADDNNGQRLTLEGILKKSGYALRSVDCGQAALSAAKEEEFAAALLDIKMPDITGIDVLKELKIQFPEMSVIMMTGYSESDYAIQALNSGASAYVLKPINIEQIKCLLNQAIEHQRLLEENRAMAAALREWSSMLEEKVKARTEQLAAAHRHTISLYEELKKNFESTMEVLAIAIDQRDPLTYSHSFRMTQYAQEIGKTMNFSNQDLEKLRYAGLMHDLGKIELEVDILCKEGSLTPEEYREIQSHAKGTYSLLSKFAFRAALADVPLIASSHHERFDGKGYPRGLKGEEISLLGRVLCVADVLDAITSRRHYRTAMSIRDVLAIMKREAGGQFDPACVNALFKIPVTNFVSIHVSDYLNKLDPLPLVEMSPYSMEDLLRASQATHPTPEQLALVQNFYRYYQGPIPDNYEGKITPAPKFGGETPKTN